MLNINDTVCNDSDAISQECSNHFCNIVKDICKEPPLMYNECLQDVFSQYDNHESIVSIKTQNLPQDVFHFSEVDEDAILKLLNSPDGTKSAGHDNIHSVESPSTVDPQWDIWYWGSKWDLHTVCWSAVGCEWGTTSVYLGITYVCFIPSRLPVFAVEPQYLLQDFLFLSKVSFEEQIQNLQKFHVGLKFEWGL